MRVSINSSIASLVVDLQEEQVLELMRTVLDKVSGKTPAPVPKSTYLGHNSPEMVPPTPLTTTPVTTKETPKQLPFKNELVRNPEVPTPPKQYKGFLYIECEKCGNFKSFMPKTPISRFICDCGHTTVLRDMKELYVDCKCGQSFKYMTNAKEPVIVIDCYGCGAPVDLEYHEKNNNYQTIK